MDVLTEQVEIAMQGDRRLVVPCAGIGPIVVALIQGELTITHARSGKRLQLSPVYAATEDGLAAAIVMRDAVLALPMEWDVEQPDPVAFGCAQAIRDLFLA